MAESKYKIEVGTSSIRIHNYELEDCRTLEKNFEVWDPIYYRSFFFGMSYNKETKTLYLPRGIDLYYVQEKLKVPTNELIFLEPNEYDTFENVGLLYKPRNDLQKQALRFMLSEGEYKRNRNYSMLLISSTTGFGKSYCSIFTICHTRIKSIVITYAITILQQWADYIFKYTNMQKDDVFLIQGAGSINMLLKERSKYCNAKVYLVSHSTLRDYANQYGWDQIDLLFKKLRVGNCFIDEAHREYGNICDICAHINVYKTYFVTATPNRSNPIEDKIYQLSMKNVPKISLYNPDIDRHINYLAIKFSSCPTATEKSDMWNAYGIDKNKYIMYLVKNPNFYKVLRVVMDMALKANGPVLFYIDINEAILIVYRWIAENYPEFAGDIGIYSGLVSGKDKYEEKSKRLILSTLKSAGAAEQIDGLKMAVILAAPFKSSVTAVQAAGRLRDPNTWFIELIDLSFNQLKKFYYAKLPTYHERMLSIKDVNINKENLEIKAADIEYKRENYILRRCPLKHVDSRFGIGNIELLHFYENGEKINLIKQY